PPRLGRFRCIPHPSATRHQGVLLHLMLPFDLHVLGMPPAFNLSQDQTLHLKVSTIWRSSILLKVRTPTRNSSLNHLSFKVWTLASMDLHPSARRPHKSPAHTVKEHLPHRKRSASKARRFVERADYSTTHPVSVNAEKRIGEFIGRGRIAPAGSEILARLSLPCEAPATAALHCGIREEQSHAPHRGLILHARFRLGLRGLRRRAVCI